MLKNRIHVYTISYNEGPFVKNFLAGYEGAERIVVYDNFSFDDTVDLLLKDSRVEVRFYDSGNQIRDDLYLEIKNHAWKEARGKAEWVIVVDFDEIFNRCWEDFIDVTAKDSQQKEYKRLPKFDLDLREQTKQGFNIIKPSGYNMISLDAPLYADGHPFKYSQKATYHVPEEKLCCFNPNELSEINYYAGCHRSEPLDRQQGVKDLRVCFDQRFKLMHYKFWNLEAYIPRMIEYQTRLSDWNRRMGAGWHYVNTAEWHRDCYVNGYNHAKYLFDVEHP